ncbi:hypothetical protein GCM10007205_12060 [Oxalicibacterium flavum]|uniref:Uncharacterized protein n=1 Tax=Oxalicibacterium flavum TaxID=179467 RepID=A0A8J2UQ59_9BURK|nr:hypothetical protein GCM10007205_12060 [Oxalicibacterium flavum]
MRIERHANSENHYATKPLLPLFDNTHSAAPKVACWAPQLRKIYIRAPRNIMRHGTIAQASFISQWKLSYIPRHYRPRRTGKIDFPVHAAFLRHRFHVDRAS